MKAYSPDPYANDETERWNGLLCPMSNHDPSTLQARPNRPSALFHGLMGLVDHREGRRTRAGAGVRIRKIRALSRRGIRIHQP
jgi:hypothetical protein